MRVEEAHGKRAVRCRSGRTATGLFLPVAFLLLAAGCGGDDPTGPDDGVSVPVDLAVGESQVLRDDGNVIRFDLPPADDGREYRLVVQSATRGPGSTPMRLRLSHPEGAAAVSPALSGRAYSSGRGAWRLAELEDRERADLAELQLRQNVRRELERVGARPARPDFPAVLHGESLEEGDTLEILFGVQDDLSIECQDAALVDTIRVEVKAVGDRAAMVEDVEVDELASVQMNYGELADEFDEIVFDTNVAYFGEPTDIDGNERVLVVFTPEVNKFSDPEEDTFIAGFFLPSDLADRQQCVSSNEGELVYLLAPDPDGDFGREFEVEQTKLLARGTSAHEFQHLINAGNRLIRQDGTFFDLEDTWLDETLSHLAEEVVGLRATDKPVRDNLSFQDVFATQQEQDAFLTFHIQNFFRLQRFFQSPESSRVLSVDDPGGIESLEMRGFAWIFGRWLGDQEGPDGSGVVEGSREEELFRELARGSGQLLTGVENVEQAILNVTGASPDWRDLLADFSPMPAVTDDAPSNVRHQLPTWDLRDVFRGLHEEFSGSFPEEYPLAVTVSGFGAGTFDFEVEGSAQKHLTLESTGSTPATTVELTNQTGGALPAGAAAQITVVRTR